MARLGGIREVMGMDHGAESKRREAEKKRAYGDQLQAQMREAQERKQRERDERFGKAPAPAALEAPGHGMYDNWSPGHLAGGEPGSPPQHAGGSMMGAGGAYSPHADMGGMQHQQYAPFSQQPQQGGPSYGQQQPQQQQWGGVPGRVQVQQYGFPAAAAAQMGAQGSSYGSPSGSAGPEPWGNQPPGQGSPPSGGYGYGQQQQQQPAVQGYGVAPPAQYGFQQPQQQGSPNGYYAGGPQQPAMGGGLYGANAGAGSGFQQQQQQQAGVAARAAAQQRHGVSDAAGAAAARKAAYRAELEAQMRDKVERKQQDKVRQQQEDRRKEAEVASYNPWGRAGAGAPMRDGNGRVVTDLKKMRSMRGPDGSDGGAGYGDDQGGPNMHHQHQQQQQQYGGGAGNSGGYGLQANAGGWGNVGGGGANGYNGAPQQHQQQQQQHNDHAPPGGGWSGYSGGDNVDEAGYGAPHHQQSQQQQPQQQQQAGAPPTLNFRSDKAFQTANEIERRSRAQQELQDALAAQIEDKRRRKEAEERKEKEEEEKELARLAREQALLQAQFDAEQQKQKAVREKADESEGKVAEAWSNANKATQRKRGSAGGAEPSHVQEHHLQQQRFNASGPALQSAQSMPAGPSNDEQALQERARQAAAEEMARLREEMAREAAVLREAMAAQQHEVAALRAAAAAAEQQSSTAKGQIDEMRRDMVRRSQEAAHETFATILADPSYGPSSSSPRVVASYHPASIRETTLNLDLPPPAPVLRRALQQASVRGLEMAGTQVTDDPFDAFRMRSMGPPPGSMGMGVNVAGPSGRTRSMPVGVGESLLVSDSTFIFPSGFQPGAAEAGGSGAAAGQEDGGRSGGWDAQHAAAAGPSNREQQYQQQHQQQGMRAGALQPSTSYGRTGLSTPLDVAGVYSRNEDKLRFLNSVNRAGGDSMEALDQFLATYANSVPQFKERRTYTPPSGLTGLGATSINDRVTVAARRGSSAHAPGLPPMRDTLDTEMQRLEGLLREVQPPVAASLLRAGQHRVEASEHSMASSSHWVKTALH